MSDTAGRKYLTIPEVLRAFADGKALENDHTLNVRQKIHEGNLYYQKRGGLWIKGFSAVISRDEFAARWWVVDEEWRKATLIEALAGHFAGKTIRRRGGNGMVIVRSSEAVVADPDAGFSLGRDDLTDQWEVLE